MEKKNQKSSKLNQSNYISYLVGEALKDIDPPGQVRPSSEITSGEGFLERLCAVPQTRAHVQNINNAIPPTGYQYATQDQLEYIVPSVIVNPGYGVGYDSTVTYIPPVSPPIQPERTHPSQMQVPSQPVPVRLYMNPDLANQIEPAVSYRLNHPLASQVDIPNTQDVNNTIHIQSNFDDSDRFAIRPKPGNVSAATEEHLPDLTTGSFRNLEQFTESGNVNAYQRHFTKAVNNGIGNRQTVIRAQQKARKSKYTELTVGSLEDLNVVTGEQGDVNFKCDICGANQTSALSLNIHKAVHSVGQLMEKTEPHMELVCGVCGMIFTNSKTLTSHIDMMHFAKENQNDATNVTADDTEGDDENVSCRRKAENDYFANFMTSERNKEEIVQPANTDNTNHTRVNSVRPMGTNKRIDMNKKGRQNHNNKHTTMVPDDAVNDKNISNRQRRMKSSEGQINSGNSSNTTSTRQNLMSNVCNKPRNSKSVRNAEQNFGIGRNGTGKQKNVNTEKKTQSQNTDVNDDPFESDDSDVQVIVEPIELIVLDDDSPTQPTSKPIHGNDLSPCPVNNKHVNHETREKDKELMEKFGLKDLSINILKKTPAKTSSPRGKDVDFHTLPKTSKRPVANLSDIPSSDLDKLLRECGMGISVPVTSRSLSDDDSRKRDTSPKPSTSKQGSDADYRPVKRPSSYISPTEQKLLAKYGIKEAKVIVDKKSDTPRKTSSKTERNIETSNKPSWLSHNFDSDASSDIELDLPSPNIDADNDEGYDADTDSCNMSVKNSLNKNPSKVNIQPCAGPTIQNRDKPKTNDELLLLKFGIKNAVVLMSDKNTRKRDSTKLDIPKETVAKENKSKTCYKKARQASDIKMTSNAHRCTDASWSKIAHVGPPEITSPSEPPRKKIKAAKNRVSEMIDQNKLDSCYTGLTEEELFIKYDIKLCEVIVNKDDVIPLRGDTTSTPLSELNFKEPRTVRLTRKSIAINTGGSNESNCQKRSLSDSPAESLAKKLRSSPRNDSNTNCADKQGGVCKRNTKQAHLKCSDKSNVVTKVSEKTKVTPNRTASSAARNENISKSDRHPRNSKDKAIVKGSEPKKVARNGPVNVVKQSPVKNKGKSNKEDVEVIDLTDDDSSLRLKTSPNQRKSKSVNNAIKTLNKFKSSPQPKQNERLLRNSPVKGISALPQKTSGTKPVKSVLKVKLPVNKSIIRTPSKRDEKVKINQCSAAANMPHQLETDVTVVIEKLNLESIGKIKENLRQKFSPAKQNNIIDDAGDSSVTKQCSVQSSVTCPAGPTINSVSLKSDDLQKQFGLNDSNSSEQTETDDNLSIQDVIHKTLRELIDRVLEQNVAGECSDDTDSKIDNIIISDSNDVHLENPLNDTRCMSEVVNDDVAMEIDVFPRNLKKHDEVDVRAVSDDDNVINDTEIINDEKELPSEDQTEKVMSETEIHGTIENADTGHKYITDKCNNNENDVPAEDHRGHSENEMLEETELNETIENTSTGHINTDNEENDSVDKCSDCSEMKAEDEDNLKEVDQEIEKCSSEKSDISETGIDNILKEQSSEIDHADGDNEEGSDQVKTNCVSPVFQGVIVDESDGSVCGHFTVNEVVTKGNMNPDTVEDRDGIGIQCSPKGDACESKSSTDSYMDRHHIDDEIHVLSENT